MRYGNLLRFCVLATSLRKSVTKFQSWYAKGQSMNLSLTRVGFLIFVCMLLLPLALLFANSAAWGQEASGQDVGTITDPKQG